MNLQTPISASPSLEQEIGRLRALASNGRHAEILADLRTLIAHFPANRDLLLLEATSQRFTGQLDESLETLDRLAHHHPEYSLMHQERGLCHVARKDAARAIESLLLAVNRNPALPLSWRMLEGVYHLIGDLDNATKAAEYVAKLTELPPPIVTATALFSDGDLEPAERIIRAFLLQHGDHPEAMRLLARIGMAREVLDDAELLLAGVLTLAPDYLAARHDYAQVLVQRHKFADAREQVDLLLTQDPVSLAYRELAATVAVGLGEHDKAIVIYHGLLEDAPATADIQLWLGHALKTVGRVPEAIKAYRAAARERPEFGDAYWSLANLKTYRFEEAELTAMRTAEAAPATAPTDRVHLCFALGKALEDRSVIPESWRYYALGNRLQREASRYRPEIIETNTAQQRAVCTPAFFAKRNGWGVPAADPIFILGLPRAGSTLIEQILASHSQVEGTQELPDIQRIVLELQGRDPDLDHPRYPGILTDLTRDDVRALGQRYLDETRAYRTDTPFFIDKMPNNFRHIGLIKLILPNARIIDARRDPMSCCFSNLKQLFARSQEFTYSIDDIARYYRTYLDLMDHWDEALPGHVLRVQHEDVIDDLEGSVRRILDHCGLKFEQACMDFHTNTRSVRTPSSEQVRRPIFRDGLDGWRAFESELEPLRLALGDALQRYRPEANL